MPAPGKRLRGPNGSVVFTNVEVGVGEPRVGTDGDGFGVAVCIAVAGMVVEMRVTRGVADPPGVLVAVDTGVEVDVGTAVDVWLGTGVFVETGAVCVGVDVAGVALFTAVGDDVLVGTGVFVAVGTPVGVPVAAVSVAVGLATLVVGVLVAVGTLVAVCVAAGEVGVDVGVAAPQGGKLGDFSGLRSGRVSLSVSMRSALARGSTAAVEIGPNGTTIWSPGATVTSSVKLPPGTGTNAAVPPRDGGMCCIRRKGRLSLIAADVGFEIVIVPETPPAPQAASMASIVRPPDATRAEPEAKALATIATPNANAINPLTAWPLRAGMSGYVSDGGDYGGVTLGHILRQHAIECNTNPSLLDVINSGLAIARGPRQACAERGFGI